jgi:hypothetical protein
MQCGTAVSRLEVENLQAITAEILLAVVAYAYGEPVAMIGTLWNVDSDSRWNSVHGPAIGAFEL